MGKEALQTALEAMGIRTEAGRYLPEACLMYRPGSVEDNPCYRQGCFKVQGESSMLVTHLLDPQPGERILDACSAPGGKTTHMADRMGCGEILAWDLHPHRIDLVRSHCRRMGVETMVQAEVQDAAAYRPDLAQTADRVLLDAPCTGWGIAHKKPDVKLKADPKARDALSKLQPVLLDHCSRYVKKGGVLVYSTCTINKKENDEPIRQFLDTHGDFVLEDFTHLLPEGLHAVYDGSGMLQLLPGRDQTDGFFIAKLRRKG
jgi:16S rRNA (cytosine967-C5)-methyltransferase